MGLRNYEHRDKFTVKDKNRRKARLNHIFMTLDYAIGYTVAVQFGCLFILFLFNIAHTNDIIRTYIFILFNLSAALFFIVRGNKRRERAETYNRNSAAGAEKR